MSTFRDLTCFIVEMNNSPSSRGISPNEVNKVLRRRTSRVLMMHAIKTDFINATTALFMTEGREDREERVEVKGSLCSGHRARAV